ncbi:MAG: aminotransferase class V-fold PLP-dependent enzyme, partial [Planctomycetota bacterium]
MSDAAPQRIYLDHAATTPPRDEVRDAMAAACERWGNPSAHATEGRRAREALDEARDSIQRSLGAGAYDVVFTSGGTEANVSAVVGAALSSTSLSGTAVRRVWVSAVEHPSILDAESLLARLGVSLSRLPVDSGGRVEIDAVRDACGEGAASLAVMAANNEVGTLQPVSTIAELARESGALFHCDAVQWGA